MWHFTFNKYKSLQSNPCYTLSHFLTQSSFQVTYTIMGIFNFRIVIVNVVVHSQINKKKTKWFEELCYSVSQYLNIFSTYELIFIA